MAVKIIEDQEPDVYLTADEHARLMDEYQKAYMFYSGTPPSFERWVVSRRGGTYTVGKTVSVIPT